MTRLLSVLSLTEFESEYQDLLWTTSNPEEEVDLEEENEEESKENPYLKDWRSTCKEENGKEIEYPLAINLIVALRKLMFQEFYTVGRGSIVWHKG